MRLPKPLNAGLRSSLLQLSSWLRVSLYVYIRHCQDFEPRDPLFCPSRSAPKVLESSGARKTMQLCAGMSSQRQAGQPQRPPMLASFSVLFLSRGGANKPLTNRWPCCRNPVKY